MAATDPGAGPTAHPFDRPLSAVLGGKTADRIARELKITTVGGLLDHVPRRWIERGELTPISQLPIDADRVDAALAACGIDRDRRPQTLGVGEWLALAEAIGPLPGDV